MKRTQIISLENTYTFCSFEGECDFKKLVSKKNANQPYTRYAICTWKDRCSQQTDRPEAVISKLIQK